MVRVMRDNEFSPIGKAAVMIGLIFAAVAAVANIAAGEPQHPLAFFAVLAGFILFLTAKLSVIARKRWISFGTTLMSPGMANAYRLGYWLMIAGTLATFVR
jgi:hypothetical protein